VVEEGGFQYSADSYADDLPYWNTSFGKPLLIIPYTLDNNVFICPPFLASSTEIYSPHIRCILNQKKTSSTPSTPAKTTRKPSTTAYAPKL